MASNGQRLEAVLGHHPAVLGVVLRPPRELGPVEGERAAGLGGDRVQHLDPGGDNLLADAVGGDGGDLENLVCGHEGLSVSWIELVRKSSPAHRR